MRLCVGGLAGRVAEVELGQVAIKRFMADVMVRAVDTALQLREVVLGVVGRHVASDVLPDAVIHDRVAGEIVAKRVVVRPLVGVKLGSGKIDLLAHRGSQIRTRQVWHHARANFARVARDQGHTVVLSVTPCLPLRP